MTLINNSWRYYTSYDNGEWRRHATPIYKADAELDQGGSSAGGRLSSSERRSAGIATTHDDIVDIDDGSEGASSHSRRAQRLRGTACLTRDMQSDAARSAATDAGPTTVRSHV